MRLGSRTRAGLSLTLGVLVGLGLVILPGILAPSTQTATSRGSYSKVTFPSAQSSSGSMNNLPNATSNQITLGSLLILVGVVLLPAVALSYFARAWTLKRAKAKLGD